MKILLTIVFFFILFNNHQYPQTIFNDNLYNQNYDSQNPDIEDVIQDINADSIASYILVLQNFQTRFEVLENRLEISGWIYNKFKSFGYDLVSFDEFLAEVIYSNETLNIDSTYLFRNVICTIPGYGAPDEKFILCAHYDSFSSNTNPLLIAPGADDNASGVAALLEIARVLKLNNTQLKRTINFVALAGEELSYYSYSGAKHYAELLSSQNENVKLVVNHDMIGYSSGLLEESIVNINRHNNSNHFADLAINLINQYTKISAQHSHYWGADLRPFYNVGYQGIYFEESIFNPGYHSDQDILNNINIPYCAEVIKGSCANIIWASSMPNSIRGIIVILVDSSNGDIKFTWNKSTDFDLDSYVVYVSKNNGLSFAANLTRDTSLIVRGIENFDQVKYAITALSTDGYESFIDIYDLNLTSINIGNTTTPEEFYLGQNYPNPFNPVTTVEYYLPFSSNAKITLFDVAGNTVKTFELGYRQKGKYQIKINAEDLTSGVYFYKLEAGKYSLSKKMIVLK